MLRPMPGGELPYDRLAAICGPPTNARSASRNARTCGGKSRRHRVASGQLRARESVRNRTRAHACPRERRVRDLTGVRGSAGYDEFLVRRAFYRAMYPLRGTLLPAGDARAALRTIVHSSRREMQPARRAEAARPRGAAHAQNKGSSGGMPTTKDFRKFQRSYLIVYVCAVMADWSLPPP